MSPPRGKEVPEQLRGRALGYPAIDLGLVMRLPRRADVVTDGDQQAKVLANAPDAREGFFAVPKVVE